jgi:hypothetical protein
MNLDLVFGFWGCPRCGGDRVLWSYTDLADKGEPICENCDGIMELLSYIGVKDEATFSDESKSTET